MAGLDFLTPETLALIAQQRRQPATAPQQTVQPSPQEQIQALAQQAASVPAAQKQTGLLAPGQSSVRDVFTNPSQSQLNAGVGLLAGLVNPEGANPFARGAVNALQQFGTTRAAENEAARAATEAQRAELRSRIKDIQTGSQVGVAESAEARQQRRFDEIDLPQFQQIALPKFELEKEQQAFTQQLQTLQEQVKIAQTRDIVEDTVGQDQFGNPITAKFSVNPVTNKKTQITGGISETTRADRAKFTEAATKTRRAIREGGIFFDKDLDKIFGPLEVRPFIGGLTEGAVQGKAKKLQADYDRFINERVLDVARVLAPVTELDFKALTQQMAPGRTFGSAQQAREWYTGTFLPKVISEVRFNASPVDAMGMVSDAISLDGVQMQDAVNIIGNGPSVEEVQGFTQSPIFTSTAPNAPLAGKAVTMSMIKQLAKMNNMSPDEFIEGAGLIRVGESNGR